MKFGLIPFRHNKIFHYQHIIFPLSKAFIIIIVQVTTFLHASMQGQNKRPFNSLETVPANVFSKVTSLVLILKGGELLEESGVPPAAQDGKE